MPGRNNPENKARGILLIKRSAFGARALN